MSSLAKVLIAMEDNAIPANLHYKNPNPDIPGLTDGRLKVVSKRTDIDGGMMAINSFGFGGSNVHALIQSNTNEVALEHPNANNMRLFTYCGRTKESVTKVLDGMESKNTNVELQSLLEETANQSSSSHPFRGFTCINSADLKTTEVDKCPITETKRPVWYVFSGMGTQWHGMGRDAMKLEVFKKSIMRSDVLLKQFKINLYDMLMTGDEKVFDDTLHSFVCLASIQVGKNTMEIKKEFKNSIHKTYLHLKQFIKEEIKVFDSDQ